jgi:hypothetical protein
LLLCHTDKQINGRDNSDMQIAFLKDVSDRLMKLSEILDPAKRLEARLLATNDSTTESMIKDYESIRSDQSTDLANLLYLLESQFFEWMIRAGLDLYRFPHLISASQADGLAQSCITQAIEKMTTFKPRAELLGLVKSINSTMKRVIKMDQFPTEALASQLNYLWNAPKRSQAFVDEALTILYQDVATWKILHVCHTLPTGGPLDSSIYESILIKRYKNEYSVFEILMLDDKSSKAMGLLEIRLLATEVSIILKRNNICIADKLQKLDKEYMLIEKIKRATPTLLATLFVTAESFGRESLKTEHEYLLNLLANSRLPGAVEAREQLGNFIDQFLARGLDRIKSFTLSSMMQMGYSIDEILIRLGDSTARWKLQTLLLQDQIEMMQKASKNIQGTIGDRKLAAESKQSANSTNLYLLSYENRPGKPNASRSTIINIMRDHTKNTEAITPMKKRPDQNTGPIVIKRERHEKRDTNSQDSPGRFPRGENHAKDAQTKRTNAGNNSRPGQQEQRRRKKTHTNFDTHSSLASEELKAKKFTAREWGR